MSNNASSKDEADDTQVRILDAVSSIYNYSVRGQTSPRGQRLPTRNAVSSTCSVVNLHGNLYEDSLVPMSETLLQASALASYLVDVSIDLTTMMCHHHCWRFLEP